MTLSPINSNSPTHRAPETTKVGKREATQSGASTRETDAAEARGLVQEIGSRLEQLRAGSQVRQDKVDEVLEEIRHDELTTRAQLERVAEALLFGDDPEAIPPA